MQALVTNVGASGIATPLPPQHPLSRRSEPESPQVQIEEEAVIPKVSDWVDPRLYLLDTAAQQHRPGSLGPSHYLGCQECTATMPGMSEARLAHSQ
jgi:hypothetical protein